MQIPAPSRVLGVQACRAWVLGVQACRTWVLGVQACRARMLRVIDRRGLNVTGADDRPGRFTRVRIHTGVRPIHFSSSPYKVSLRVIIPLEMD